MITQTGEWTSNRSGRSKFAHSCHVARANHAKFLEFCIEIEQKEDLPWAPGAT